MPHNAVLGSQQLTEKQVIDRVHPAIVRGKAFRQDGRILPAGTVVAKDTNSEMAAWEPGLADAASWAATTAVSAGALVVPATANGRYYRCTTGGTTGSSEPAWPTTTAGTVTDGTVIWEEAGLLGVDDLEGGGVLVEQIDTAEEQVGSALVHGAVVAANLLVAGAAPTASDLEALDGIGIYAF